MDDAALAQRRHTQGSITKGLIRLDGHSSSTGWKRMPLTIFTPTGCLSGPTTP